MATAQQGQVNYFHFVGILSYFHSAAKHVRSDLIQLLQLCDIVTKQTLDFVNA